jgi:hypothetical protein
MMDRGRRDELRRTLLTVPSMGGRSATLENALREALDAVDAISDDLTACNTLRHVAESARNELRRERDGLREYVEMIRGWADHHDRTVFDRGAVRSACLVALELTKGAP